MMAKDEDYGIRLSTGNQIYANACVIGIDAHGEISGGYDDPICLIWHGSPELTKPGLVELADHMIARWQKFKDTHSG